MVRGQKRWSCGGGSGGEEGSGGLRGHAGRCLLSKRAKAPAWFALPFMPELGFRAAQMQRLKQGLRLNVHTLFTQLY